MFSTAVEKHKIYIEISNIFVYRSVNVVLSAAFLCLKYVTDLSHSFDSFVISQFFPIIT